MRLHLLPTFIILADILPWYYAPHTNIARGHREQCETLSRYLLNDNTHIKQTTSFAAARIIEKQKYDDWIRCGIRYRSHLANIKCRRRPQTANSPTPGSYIERSLSCLKVRPTASRWAKASSAVDVNTLGCWCCNAYPPNCSSSSGIAESDGNVLGCRTGTTNPLAGPLAINEANTDTNTCNTFIACELVFNVYIVSLNGIFAQPAGY